MTVDAQREERERCYARRREIVMELRGARGERWRDLHRELAVVEGRIGMRPPEPWHRGVQIGDGVTRAEQAAGEQRARQRAATRDDPSPASPSETDRLAAAIYPALREIERRSNRTGEPFCACHLATPFDCPDQAWV